MIVNRVQFSRLRKLVMVLWPAVLLLAAAPAASADPFSCPAGPNQIACENALPGDPQSDWQIDGNGDSTIQGFATQMSVDAGQTISFKIDTPSTNYHIDILRLGYYGGDGARKIVSDMKPTATLPQTQPSCLTDATTALVDCGIWSVSASWTVPSDAVSGLYIAHLVRDDKQDPGGDSQIPFVVRNDASHSDIVVQTSDASWEAYNTYGGGNSLYQCQIVCPSGNPLAYKGAYAVSYNRPFTFTDDGGIANPYYAEYPMIYFLEQNGYDVSYIAEADTDRSGSLLLNHKLFISSGHDEYWSGQQRSNVEAALAAGVNLAFFSGNEVFWKTRWTNSIDGSNTPYRTLVSYKETHFNAPVDPQDPPTWTGAWADPRFSPPADGGKPANALTGQMFDVNNGTATMTVPYNYAKLRFWRHTAVAQLQTGQTLSLAPNTVGYEWDLDVDNGFRPAGLFDLSSTKVSGLQVFTDYGSTTVNNGTATHNLTLSRAPSGAVVFGAGTVQWSWGLDDQNPNHAPPNAAMQQATVNLFADMGVQPQTLMSGLVPATSSTDTTPPTSQINSPSAGANLQDGSQVRITGTATDSHGGVVAGVEISTDGGTTWHPAPLSGPADTTVNWSYTWIAHGAPSTTIETRAVDDSGNLEKPSDGITVNVTCPCSLWGNNVVPSTPDSGDGTDVEVGVKFTSGQFGQVSGIRFYKATTNTGTHVGSIWTASGQLLASATFTNETSSGWQTVTFSNPVTILPNTTYVAGYFAPNGHYAATNGWFYPSPAPTPLGGAAINSPPLHALTNVNGGNGVYVYTSSSAFPSNSFGAANYWVDVLFSPSPAPGQVTNVSATAGHGSATVTWSAPGSGGPVTTYTITPYIGNQAQTQTTVTGTPPATSATVLGLTPGTSYTFTVQASNQNGAGTVSSQSNAVTPTPDTAPSAPTNVTANPASSQALVSWTAPSDTGGMPITGYTITPYLGSAAQTPVQVAASQTSATVTGLTNGSSYTFTVTATNSIGSTTSPASGAAVPADTVFDFSRPTLADGGDGGAVEVGMQFQASVAGQITGIRFYKAATNTGTHTGSLWTASGSLLARGTFTNETGSGWQTVNFSQPVTINPGTTYVASYLAPNGHYSYAGQGFSSTVTNGPLEGLSNSVAPNGLYAYSGTDVFPTNTFNAANYYVDVMFVPTVAPGVPTSVTATAGNAGATVSWTAPTTGGAPTSYVITPYIGSQAQATTTVSGNPPNTTGQVSNLTPGTQYTFTVKAANAGGSSSESAQSNPVTPGGAVAPSAPTNVVASPASGQALVSWTDPTSDGGSPITGYTVTPYIGGSAQTPTQASASQTSAIVTGLTDGTSYTFKVTAKNAVGSTDSAASSAIAPADTLFDFNTPGTVDGGDGGSINLGVRFAPSVAGQVVGIRFYKATTNTGTHVGDLWSDGGGLLASTTFTGESASGWQTMLFNQPVSVNAGSTYVASYFAPNGHYSFTGAAFNSALTNGPLEAVPASTEPDGVYSYASSNSFPTNQFNATNYWVDVLFIPSQ